MLILSLTVSIRCDFMIAWRSSDGSVRLDAMLLGDIVVYRHGKPRARGLTNVDSETPWQIIEKGILSCPRGRTYLMNAE